MNINDHVTVRLTPDGRDLVLACGWVDPANVPPAGEPYTEQLWILMRALGPKMSMAGPQLIVNNAMEIESEPTSDMPDPWPNMLVEYNEAGCGWRRAVIYLVRTDDNTFYCEGSVSTPWTPVHVREVRSPDGRVLWKASIT